MTDPRLTQPAGWATHCTIRDDNAPHQIRIVLIGPGHNTLALSCTCSQDLGVIAPGTTAEQILAEHRTHVADATVEWPVDYPSDSAMRSRNGRMILSRKGQAGQGIPTPTGPETSTEEAGRRPR